MRLLFTSQPGRTLGPINIPPPSFTRVVFRKWQIASHPNDWSCWFSAGWAKETASNKQFRWCLLWDDHSPGTWYLNLHQTKLIPQNTVIHIYKTADKGTVPDYSVSLWDHKLKPQHLYIAACRSEGWITVSYWSYQNQSYGLTRDSPNSCYWQNKLLQSSVVQRIGFRVIWFVGYQLAAPISWTLNRMQGSISF